MTRIRVPLGVGLRRGRSSVGGMSGTVNCFAEPVKGEGRTGLAIYPFPGKTLFSTIGGGTVRGQLDFATYHAAVVGTRLYTIDASGTATDRGEIEGTDRTDLDFNGAQLFVQGTTKSYYYDPATAVPNEVTDSDFQGATSACSLDGYTITSVPSSDRIQWFALRDASSVDGLDFATAETNGDRNVAVRVANKDLHVFGEKTLEFFYHSGNPDQQFESKAIPPLEIGCLARDSIALMDTGFNWVGRDGKSGGIGVYRMAGGYTAKKISTPAVDRFLEEYDESLRSSIHALGFQFHAHQFYCLHLPGTVSLYYDQATNEWGFLKSGTYAMSADPLGGWDALTFATNGGKRIVGASDGNLYELDGGSFTENGAEIIREIICSQLTTNTKHGAILHEHGIDMEVGIGLATGQGSDPVIMCAKSVNGGKSWQQRIDRPLGAAGKYLTNVSWTRASKYKNMILKYRLSDPVMFAAFSGYAEIEPLS